MSQHLFRLNVLLVLMDMGDQTNLNILGELLKSANHPYPPRPSLVHKNTAVKSFLILSSGRLIAKFCACAASSGHRAPIHQVIT